MCCCTFFGHRDCPSSIEFKLRATLIDLIENHNVDRFYVGNHGAFDVMVRSTLRELKTIYPHIDYAVVLAYLPTILSEFGSRDFADTLLPEGIESVPKRYAISWRNNWMLNQADYVVTYITHSWGGAAQYAEKSKRQKKKVLNLA